LQHSPAWQSESAWQHALWHAPAGLQHCPAKQSLSAQQATAAHVPLQQRLPLGHCPSPAQEQPSLPQVWVARLQQEPAVQSPSAQHVPATHW
jgi:hypothetical protein